jgi:hypothetical protein
MKVSAVPELTVSKSHQINNSFLQNSGGAIAPKGQNRRDHTPKAKPDLVFVTALLFSTTVPMDT